MKLATYRDGSRDGQLVVVSRDLALAHYASGIASRLQQVLDDWNFLAPQLEDLSATLNGGKARHAFAFDPARCAAPLPRSFQWALAPGTAGGPAPQRASDDLLGPGDDIVLPGPDAPARLQAGFAVVTGDLPRGAARAQALECVRLVLLAHVWSLPGGAQPAGALAPLAVTPDELGAAWRGGRVHLAVRTLRQAGASEHAEPGQGCPDFGDVLAALAQVRGVRAGSIIGPHAEAGPAEDGSGPPGAPAGAAGWHDGELAHSEVTGPDGLSVFGAIAQRIVRAGSA
jgi:fumarylacetoacetate (FAA) hydrolase